MLGGCIDVLISGEWDSTGIHERYKSLPSDKVSANENGFLSLLPRLLAWHFNVVGRMIWDCGGNYLN